MEESNAESRVATPSAVAQRMADLLQCFPSAAIGGIQWHTLRRKYEERYGAALDLEVLGHTSALAAATALLWDVIRVVEADDTDNPVVAVEDAVALTPSPGCLASWPSLYQVLCEIVRNHGTLEKKDDADSGGAATRFILLSQVKPLLQRHWHSNFDESGLSYFTEEGTTVKCKKMKHLLQALLRWRTTRVEWRTSMLAAASAPGASTKETSRGVSTAVDAVVAIELELVPSKSHNDLLLRCVCQEGQPEACTSPEPAPVAPVRKSAPRPELRLELPRQPEEKYQASPADTPTTARSSDPMSPSCRSSSALSCTSAERADRLSCASAGSERLEQELALLRSENAKLRSENDKLERRACADAALRAELFQTPARQQAPPPEMPEVFDDPFEPPPEIRSFHASSPACSTPGSFGFGSGSLTPFSESSTSRAASGYVTPVPPPAEGFPQGVTLVPVSMWFPMGDRLQIPCGVVQQARAMFERHAVVPSFFAQR